EKLLQIGKKVAIVDFDFETQDLSRFLQSKPFVNDPLQLMLEQSRPITEEFVAQALSPVWNDEQQLLCMSPAPEAEELYAANSSYSRSFLSIFQVLDGGFDAVVVDSGSARGSLLRTLYRIADTVVFAINNDPATLYASADRLSKARAWMSVGADLVILENASMKSGLSQRILRHEFSRAVQLDDEQWLSEAVPFCPRAARWPGSGATMVTLGRPQVSKAFDQLVERLGFQSQRERNAKIKLFKRIKKPAIEHHDGRTEEDNGNNKNVIYLIDQNRGSQDSQEPALSADDLSEVVQEVVLSEQQLNTNDFSMDLDEVVSEVAFESDQRAKTVRGSLA
ncbi:MAG: hypothetical protein KDD62_11700, partial [Bdellovibrionales bacterium]|nr:hypothetical protein [Bdellovibrionales bacterium]